jgi:predicted RNase H-like nuclease (RuvC/YqgF family)
MSKADELKAKNENLFEHNTILLNENERLKKENAELKKKLKEKLKNIADKDLSFVAKFDALENENAELKKKIGIYQKGMYEEIEKRDKKLTKAKELLDEFMRISKASDEDFEHDYSELIGVAEQFIKDENIILEDAQAGNSPFDAEEVFKKEMKAYPEEKVK